MVLQLRRHPSDDEFNAGLSKPTPCLDGTSCMLEDDENNVAVPLDSELSLQQIHFFPMACPHMFHCFLTALHCFLKTAAANNQGGTQDNNNHGPSAKRVRMAPPTTTAANQVE
ncbi:hypothetical protein HPB49_006324 [Dermacentor silvarum]|uniref:Uncharacterized protein n=1 Tax=Dermacentor silvarum TaxID=543639 RepID=A0ACB8C7Q2_DERSI|nr:hypothetical protein HPB49_006324 [Dermacentor silvarum]